jgi:oxygen-dependent protoporphyrinogen oxidase
VSVPETAVAGAKAATALVRRRLRPERGESVSAFANRIGGRALTESLLGPALQGIYGAQPQELSATAIFGGPRRVRGPLAAPENGMGAFVDGLSGRLADRGVVVTCKAPVRELAPGVPTVVCTGVAAAAALVAPHAPGLSDAMSATRTAGLTTVTAFFERRDEDLDGFGVLFPRTSGVCALGVLFNSSIFEGRSRLRSETWIYAEPPTRERADVVEQITADRVHLTGTSTPPVALTVTRHEAALPVYGPTIDTIKGRLAELPPWLRLSGNYLGQIGVTNLLARADAIAAEASTAWA